MFLLVKFQALNETNHNYIQSALILSNNGIIYNIHPSYDMNELFNECRKKLFRNHAVDFSVVLNPLLMLLVNIISSYLKVKLLNRDTLKSRFKRQFISD